MKIPSNAQRAAAMAAREMGFDFGAGMRVIHDWDVQGWEDEHGPVRPWSAKNIKAYVSYQDFFITDDEAEEASRLMRAAMIDAGLYEPPAPKKKASRNRAGKKPTFAQAKEALISHLRSQGWAWSGPLKVPHLTSHIGRDQVRLWFKPQAIYIGVNTNNMGDARSLHVDARELSPQELEADIIRWVNWKE